MPCSISGLLRPNCAFPTLDQSRSSSQTRGRGQATTGKASIRRISYHCCKRYGIMKSLFPDEARIYRKQELKTRTKAKISSLLSLSTAVIHRRWMPSQGQYTSTVASLTQLKKGLSSTLANLCAIINLLPPPSLPPEYIMVGKSSQQKNLFLPAVPLPTKKS